MDMNKQVTKQLKTLRKEFAEWVETPVMIKNFRDEPPMDFQAYLDGKKKSSTMGLRADEFLTWHYNQYAHAVLNEARYPLDELALCARYARAAVGFEAARADAGRGGSILPDQAAFNFSLNVLAGGRHEAGMVGRMLYKGLDTALLDLRHTDQHEAGKFYRHFWFLMHLYCDATERPLDTSLYSYPEDLSPYRAVLADWRTADVNQVQGFVSAMADFHVQEASSPEEITELNHRYQILFPHEILTFLRLREWAGLPNPESFEHPLMQQPLAKLPAPPSPAPPATPLLDHVIKKFQQEYPGSFDWKMADGTDWNLPARK